MAKLDWDKLNNKQKNQPEGSYSKAGSPYVHGHIPADNPYFCSVDKLEYQQNKGRTGHNLYVELTVSGGKQKGKVYRHWFGVDSMNEHVVERATKEWAEFCNALGRPDLADLSEGVDDRALKQLLLYKRLRLKLRQGSYTKTKKVFGRVVDVQETPTMKLEKFLPLVGQTQ